MHHNVCTLKGRANKIVPRRSQHTREASCNPCHSSRHFRCCSRGGFSLRDPRLSHSHVKHPPHPRGPAYPNGCWRRSPMTGTLTARRNPSSSHSRKGRIFGDHDFFVFVHVSPSNLSEVRGISFCPTTDGTGASWGLRAKETKLENRRLLSELVFSSSLVFVCYYWFRLFVRLWHQNNKRFLISFRIGVTRSRKFGGVGFFLLALRKEYITEEEEEEEEEEELLVHLDNNSSLLCFDCWLIVDNTTLVSILAVCLCM